MLRRSMYPPLKHNIRYRQRSQIPQILILPLRLLRLLLLRFLLQQILLVLLLLLRLNELQFEINHKLSAWVQVLRAPFLLK